MHQSFYLFRVLKCDPWRFLIFFFNFFSFLREQKQPRTWARARLTRKWWRRSAPPAQNLFKNFLFKRMNSARVLHMKSLKRISPPKPGLGQDRSWSDLQIRFASYDSGHRPTFFAHHQWWDLPTKISPLMRQLFQKSAMIFIFPDEENLGTFFYELCDFISFSVTCGAQ